MANRVALGALPGGGMGLRVSRPGFNVLSTTLQPKQVSFDSSWQNSLKLVTRGVVTIPSGGGSTTVNYGKTIPNPFVVCVYRTRANGEWHNAVPIYPEYEDTSTTGSIQFAFDSDLDNHLIEIYNNRLFVRFIDAYDRLAYMVGER